MTIGTKGLESSEPRAVGEIPTNHPALNIRTLVAEGAIGFGRAVQQGTAGDQGKVFSSASAEFIGVASVSKEASNLDNEAYADADVMGVCDSGIINVYVEEAVNIGDPVRVRHTADTGKYVGDFATTADAGKTVLLTGAEFRSATTAAGIAQLFLAPEFAVTADT